MARSVFVVFLVGTMAIAWGVGGMSVVEAEEFYTIRSGAVRPAIDFRILDASLSSKLDWDDLEGEIVVIDFWATWCAPCVEAFPKFNELGRRFADQPVRFISVTYETEAMIRPFLAKRPLETEIALDNDFATYKSFDAWGIPTVYVFDRQGTLLSAMHPEYLSAEVIAGALAGDIPPVEQARGWEDPAGAEEYFRSLVVEPDGKP